MTRHKSNSFPEQWINVKVRHMNLLSLKLETKWAGEVKHNTNPAGPLSLYPWSAVLAKQHQRKYKIPRFTFSDIVQYNAKYFDCFVGVFFNTTSSKLFKICPKLNLFFLLQSLVLYIQDYLFSALSPDFLEVLHAQWKQICVSYPNKILLWYSVVIDHVSLRQAPKCVAEVQVERAARSSL